MAKVVIIRFRIAKGREEEWERFVAARSQDAAAQDGFERMYLLKPDGGDMEYRVVSWWKRLDDPEAWIRRESYAYSESADHAGIVTGPTSHETLELVRQF